MKTGAKPVRPTRTPHSQTPAAAPRNSTLARVERKAEGAKKPGRVAQDQAQVVAGTAQQGMGGVAQRAVEVVAREPAVELHVADHRLARGTAPQLTKLPRRARHQASAANCGRRGERPAQRSFGPPRWKLAALSWFGIFPVVTAMLALAVPWLEGGRRGARADRRSRAASKWFRPSPEEVYAGTLCTPGHGSLSSWLRSSEASSVS
jgi:hypothetical protein